MKAGVRYSLVFAGALAGGLWLHEFGHAVAAWAQGIAAVPSPAKEYILRPEVFWEQQIWIALGGVLGTALAALGATLYFLKVRTPVAEAVLFGALNLPWFYTIRLILLGRGHDGTEWQAAQAALGLAPAGHAIDVFFLCVSLAGIIVWASGLRFPLRYHLLRLLRVAIGGAILLLALQAANNRLLDRFFPRTQVVDAPSGLDPR